MPFAFHYAARSDVGMVRSNNEDSGYAGPHLLAMADGMGGHAGGDVASSTVIGALVRLDGEALGGRDVSHALLDRIHRANTEIGDQVHADPSLDGMGTTLIALLRAGDKIVLAHIGDSRAFMVRDGEVTQITKDHSFVQNLVDEGRITADEAQTHPQRSLVTRVLTGADDDDPDLVVRQGRIGDRYVISSDGLTDYVARDTINEVLTTTADPGETADRLVALALRAGAPDNVTIVVGDLVDIAAARPPTQPQVVGAAAARQTGTRPIPTTPAAKAAALTAHATGRRRPRRRRHPRRGGSAVPARHPAAPGRLARRARRRRRRRHVRRVRVVPAPVLPRRGRRRGRRVPRGRAEPRPGVAVRPRVLHDDPRRRPAELVPGQPAAGHRGRRPRGGRRPRRRPAAAGQACRWAQLHGEVCRTVPSTWTTPTPPPSPTPTATPHPDGPHAVAGSPSPAPSATGTPVTS